MEIKTQIDASNIVTECPFCREAEGEQERQGTCNVCGCCTHPFLPNSNPIRLDILLDKMVEIINTRSVQS